MLISLKNKIEKNNAYFKSENDIKSKIENCETELHNVTQFTLNLNSIS